MKKLMSSLFLALILFCCSTDDNSGGGNDPDPPVLTTLNISSSNGNELDLNGTNTATLSVSGVDQYGNAIAISGTVQWSSNNANVSVDQNGLVTAQAVGSSIVTATADSVSEDFNFTVIDSTPVLTSLVISSSNGDELDLNGTTTTMLSVEGRDQFNNEIAIGGTVEWSANNSNVTVDENGLVTAQTEGESVVTASVDDISEDYTITVIDTTPETGTFIYVSDAVNFNSGPWNIYKYDENGENGEVFIDEELAWPQDIIFLEDVNEVLISNLSSNTINRYNATTGAFIGNFATGASGPTRMEIGTDNLLYVLQWTGDGLVQRYDLDGNFVDNFTDTGITQSIGMAWDSQGNYYVSSYNNGTVTKFDSNGNSQGLFVDSVLQGPTNIWFDENDNLFVLDWTADVVAQFDSNGNFVQNIITTGIDQPEGVAFYPNGNFLIGSGGTSEVKLYDSNGNFIENFVSAGAAGLVRPNAVRIRVIN